MKCWLFSGFVLMLFQVQANAQFAPASVISPTLKFVRSNENLTVFWPASPFDFLLLSRSDLTGSESWATPRGFGEGDVCVTVPMTNAQQFFRVLSPYPLYPNAILPVFRFAIFSALNLEIAPGAITSVSGAVHCNSNIFVTPENVLTFESHVTAAGNILRTNSPLDPTTRSPGTVIYEGGHRSGVIPLTLGFDTNYSPTALRQIIEMPPATEPPTSAIGADRFYNKADMIITVSNSSTSVTSGRINNFATIIPQSQWSYFLSQISFFNQRENKTVNAIQIDIGKLRAWNATNVILRPVVGLGGLGGDVRSIYVIDQRSQTSATESGVRLVNGQMLPPRGLSVATPNPLYIKGNYNAPPATLGTHDTWGTMPAALIGDSITVLSANWNDANSTGNLGGRIAADTTVNAAFLAGIVQTTTNSFSGGVENFPRFLEDWSGKTFTYNGSMVVMYESIYATGVWNGSGSAIGIYNPPIRNWAFDTNFRDYTKLPPGTPFVGVLAPTN